MLRFNAVQLFFRRETSGAAQAAKVETVGHEGWNKTGHLLARVTKDLEEIGELAHHGPDDVFIAVMTLVGAFALMFSVHWQLAIVTAAVLPAFAVVVTRYGNRMMRNWEDLYERIGTFNTRIEESIGGIRVMKAFANEDHERRLFARDNRRYRTTKIDAYRMLAAGTSINYLGLRLVQVIVMLAGTYFVVRGSLTVGGFVGFLLLVDVFYRPLEHINGVIETYPRGIAGFKRYSDLLSTAADIIDRPGAISCDHLKGNIRFEGVRFEYERGRPVIAGFSLDIEAGDTIALVGSSGAGKTTICSLLPRFYEIDAGRIMIDGMDIRDMTLDSLRRNIGIVQQDVFLFAGTIRENVVYGRLDASDADVWDALRRSRLDSFVRSLSRQLDTIVGERGVKLSGGQKQRLAIARIFLKNPPILILDEATSALDTATELEIQASLKDLARGRTTLVIAHRLGTIRHSDRIVVVGAGGVVEQGDHEELIAINGSYRSFYEA